MLLVVLCRKPNGFWLNKPSGTADVACFYMLGQSAITLFWSHNQIGFFAKTSSSQLVRVLGVLASKHPQLLRDAAALEPVELQSQAPASALRRNRLG